MKKRDVITGSEQELLQLMQEDLIQQNTYDLAHYNWTVCQGERYRVDECLERILPEEKRLALCLYRRMYTQRPQESVQWIEESPNLFHNWDGELHKKYLKQAKKLLQYSDYASVIRMLDILFTNWQFPED